MKTMLSAAVAGLALMATPAIAQSQTDEGYTVVEKNASGKVTKVSKDGTTYDVCMSDAQDSCINPREAGLKWGNRPLGYWPGQPASEM